ncbi:hypothetical protein Tco_0973956 [Tanacetum coccineum]|uniref:Uncharacterized protein n=1 Tax=Tanacetum coccineum TaxID=301880 RepID=A0ABQ5EA86_9ASTR
MKVINMIRVERSCKRPFEEGRVQGSWKEVQWRQCEEQMSRIREQVILRSKSNPERGPTLDTMSLGKAQSKDGIENLITSSRTDTDQYGNDGATFSNRPVSNNWRDVCAGKMDVSHDQIKKNSYSMIRHGA